VRAIFQTGLNREDRQNAAFGVILAILAYSFWGLAPLYFRQIKAVPPLEQMGHRILWTVLLLATLMTFRRQWIPTLAILRQPGTLWVLAGSTLLISVNWFLFIFANWTDQVLEASLGYFINPLLNVVLGGLLLGERLRPLQRLGVVLATVGVVVLTFHRGHLPWIALALAFSFGFYGFIRKTGRLGSLPGLMLETLLVLPIAAWYLVHLEQSGGGHFAKGNLGLTVLLPCAGVVTAFPLLCFAGAARRLRYSTLGFLQYLAPTGQFLLGVFAFGEAFDGTSFFSFSLIWVALAVYSIDSVRATRQAGRTSIAQPRIPVVKG
jgi:chloramphenicol-sensitive protein RarD